MSQKAGGKFNYQEWYEKNKEDIARKRQERYENDPEYREKAIARSRFHYWNKQRKNSVPQPVDMDDIVLESTRAIPVQIENPMDARYGTAIEVPVFNAGELGKLLERSAQTIRLWERRGVIPKAFWRDGRGYRLYTQDQVIAFLECKHLLDLPMRNIEDSVFSKELTEAWEDMPDGVKVEESIQYVIKGICTVCSRDTERVAHGHELDKVRCQHCGSALHTVTKSEML